LSLLPTEQKIGWASKPVWTHWRTALLSLQGIVPSALVFRR